MTTDDLLRHLADACQSSAIAKSYVVDASDEDSLSVRAFLIDGSFINAFYNLISDKVAFAWIREDVRLYGKDNAKMDWHAHPFEDPARHSPCMPVDFATFLGEIEIIFKEHNHG